MSKLLTIVFARSDVNASKLVSSFYISGREYFKHIGLDVNLTNEVVGVLMNKGIMDTTFHSEVEYNVRALNDLDYILKLYYNFKTGKPLLNDISGIHFIDTIKHIDKKYDKELPYDYVAFSSYDCFLFFELYALFIIKNRNPKIKTVIGGNTINNSHVIGDFLAELQGIDYVISGDFENSIEMLLTNKLNEGMNIVEPFDLKLLPPIVYTAEDSITTDGYITLTPSRSCPYKCSFCSTAGLSDFRYVPTDNFTEWVRLNNEAGVSHTIMLNSPTTNWSEKQFEEMLDGLIDIKNELRICGWFRIEKLNENLISKMKRAGFIVTWIGVDALNGELRAKLNKGELSVDKAVQNLTLLDRYGIRVSAAFIRYIPGMTQHENYMELLFYKSLRKKFTTMRMTNFHYILMSGSPMEANPQQFGIKVNYWKNPNPNLPELDDVICRIKQNFEYDSSDITVYEEFKHDNGLEIHFEELRNGYIPDTKMGRKYKKLIGES